MPKPDPALLDPARYPFTCSLDPRFGDLDINMHVNNVALIGLFEESRVRFHRENGYSLQSEGRSSMVASFSVEFLGEAFYPDPLAIHCALAHIGRTSQTIYQIAMQKDRLVGFAQSVIVSVQDGKPAALDEAYRQDVQRWMLRG